MSDNEERIRTQWNGYLLANGVTPAGDLATEEELASVVQDNIDPSQMAAFARHPDLMFSQFATSTRIDLAACEIRGAAHRDSVRARLAAEEKARPKSHAEQTAIAMREINEREKANEARERASRPATVDTMRSDAEDMLRRLGSVR